MRADLHVHSTASDGTLAPRDLVELAHHRHVDVLAIADHDSIDGIPDASAAARKLGITLIPAVEMAAYDDGFDVHILAYHVDIQDPTLRELLARSRDARLRRAQAMVAGLKTGGFVIELDDVYLVSGDAAVGRSHIARALVAVGEAESVSDAFSRLIGRGRPFYVAREAQTPQQVITAIRGLGAVPVLAHPGISAVDELIPGMIASGLLGIEAYHADHSAEARQRYAALAARHGLIATGGTDYHGPDAPNPELGSVDVPTDEVRKLLALGSSA